MSFRTLLVGARASLTNLWLPSSLGATKSVPLFSSFAPMQQRFASNLGPRRTKYRKSHKGRVSFPTGGSVKGTTVTQGMYGIRTLEPSRITATQLTAAETALKRKLKIVRGSQVFMRVFPDVPVCVKGNETRMGKGKGAFEYWACRYVMVQQHMLIKVFRWVVYCLKLEVTLKCVKKLQKKVSCLFKKFTQRFAWQRLNFLSAQNLLQQPHHLVWDVRSVPSLQKIKPLQCQAPRV